MKVAKGLITAGVVALHATFGTEAQAQDCDTSWFEPYTTPTTLLTKPVDTWNMNLIASAGPEKVALLIGEVNGTLKSTLDNEVANIFDGINDAVANQRDIDWTYYKGSYNPIFTPVLEKAEADIKGGADASAIIGAARTQGTIAASRHIMDITEKLAALDTSKPQCLFVAPAAPAPAGN